jgi:hypothetical protein
MATTNNKTHNESSEIKALIGVKKTEINHTEYNTHISGVDSVRITDGTAHVHTVIEEVNWKDIEVMVGNGMAVCAVIAPWLGAMLGVGLILKAAYVYRVELAIGGAIVAATAIVGLLAYKFAPIVIKWLKSPENSEQPTMIKADVVSSGAGINVESVALIAAENKTETLKQPALKVLLGRMAVLSHQNPNATAETLYRIAMLEYNGISTTETQCLPL